MWLAGGRFDHAHSLDSSKHDEVLCAGDYGPKHLAHLDFEVFLRCGVIGEKSTPNDVYPEQSLGVWIPDCALAQGAANGVGVLEYCRRQLFNHTV